MNIKNFVEYGVGLDNLPNSKVIFVGLSYKLSKDGAVLEAFCDSTNSGKVINKLEEGCPDISIHKTNLVKGVPLLDGKIRYPNFNEKKEGLDQLLEEIGVIKPEIVYLFGKQVSDFVIKNLEIEKISDFEYIFGDITFILAHHPSYIYIYKRKEKKRKEMGTYINSIVSKIQYIIYKIKKDPLGLIKVGLLRA